MTRLIVNMSGPDDGHDFDVIVEINGEQEHALAAVVAALPDHVWYRWRDLTTGENGRNQAVFPWEADDWDETADGVKYDCATLYPVEDDYGPPPLYKNRYALVDRVKL